MNVWVATGSSLNLKTSLKKGKWGVNKRLKKTWEKVANGDLLFFYVTSPVRGIVGLASVEGKAIEESILRHDEAVVGRVLYPYRILFKPLFMLNEDKWKTDRIRLRTLTLVLGRV